MRNRVIVALALVFVAAVGFAAMRDVILPGHSFIVDSSNRVLYGWGVKPTTPALPDGTPVAIGTPFWDTSTNAFYYWSGSAWTANTGASLPLAGGTLTGPLLGTSAFFTGPVSIGDTSVAPYANLYGDAANTLALRNGGTAGTPVPQAFNVYNFCDGAACATGSEKGFVRWVGNAFQIGNIKAGTGANRSTQFFAGNFGMTLDAAAGQFYPNNSDTQTLGAVAAPWMTAHLSRSIQGGKSKALTDATPVAFVRVAVPQTVDVNFAGGDVVWIATAKDATPHTESLSGRLTFSAINNAGTEVCTVDPTAAVTAPNANSSGTLACTFTCASNAADTIDLIANCDTSLGTPTGVSIFYRLDMPQPNTVTPQ